jgi:hypothetical protein
MKLAERIIILVAFSVTAAIGTPDTHPIISTSRNREAICLGVRNGYRLIEHGWS